MTKSGRHLNEQKITILIILFEIYFIVYNILFSLIGFLNNIIILYWIYLYHIYFYFDRQKSVAQSYYIQ